MLEFVFIRHIISGLQKYRGQEQQQQSENPLLLFLMVVTIFAGQILYNYLKMGDGTKEVKIIIEI